MELETNRLALKPTHPNYFDGLWDAIQISLDELRPWMPWAVEPDAERTLAFTENAANEWASGHERAFTMFYEGEVCGQCSLDHFDAIHANYEIGYWLRSDLAGRGLMTEGAASVVRFGFGEQSANRIELHAGVGNMASIRVAEKLGFQHEGTLRGAGRGAEGFHDVHVYGLLAGDPRPI